MGYLGSAYTAIIVDQIIPDILDDIFVVHVLDDLHVHFPFGLF